LWVINPRKGFSDTLIRNIAGNYDSVQKYVFEVKKGSSYSLPTFLFHFKRNINFKERF